MMTIIKKLFGNNEPSRKIDYVIPLTISGLGIIFYSPFSVAHIKEGEDYLESSFMQPADVARHVMDCSISAVGTGSPGDFVLRLYDGPYPERATQEAMVAIRLGIEIRDSALCFRDLYDMMEWNSACPKEQSIQLADRFYRLTVFTSLPSSGILGDNQAIDFHFEGVGTKPVLKWQGVPDISEQY